MYLQALAHFIVADDIMDNSVTRRGQLCWYKQVGEYSLVIRLTPDIQFIRMSVLVLGECDTLHR